MSASRRAVDFAYRPALDGLRALSVLAVLLFHAGVPFLPGGFLGVDAFFVLSGFLITSLLLAEQARTGGIRLGAFWVRRARRLLPALLLVLAVVVLAYRYQLVGAELAALRGDALSALGYVANWRMVYRGEDYFARTSTPSPLRHTWSLGIEEQFYLLWPLLIVLVLWLLRTRVRPTLLVLCALGAAASAVAGALLYRPLDVDRAYFGTDTRAQDLLIGCALAVILAYRPADTARNKTPHHEAPRNKTPHHEAPHHEAPRDKAPRDKARHYVVGALGLVGLAFTGWLWTYAHGGDAWLFRGGFALGGLAVAAVIAYTTLVPRAPLSRALAVAPLAALGRISYGVYLWHWPLYGLLTADRTGLTGLALLALRVITTLAVATLSYVLVEQPVRTGHWPRFSFRSRPPVPPRLRTTQPRHKQNPAAAPARPRATKSRALSATGALLAVLATGVLILAGTTPPASRPGGPAAALRIPATPADDQRPPPVKRPGRTGGALARVTFFGDSVSWSIGTYLPPDESLAVTVRAVQGCGIARLPDIVQLGEGHTNYDACPTWDQRWRRGVEVEDPDVAVILLDRWELMDRKLHGSYQHVGQPDYDRYLMSELDLAVSIVAARGALVVLLTAPYTRRAERPDGGLYDEDRPERVDAWNHLLRERAKRSPRQIAVLDLNARVCPDGRFTWNIDQLRIRSDGLHFTPDGVREWIAPWLLPQLSTLATGAVAATRSPTPTPTAAGSPR